MSNRLRSFIVALLLLSSTVALAQPPVSHHWLVVNLADGSGEIEIFDRVSITGRNEFRFRLASWLKLESLSLDGQAITAQPRGSDYRLEFDPHKDHHLEFKLRGRVPARDGAAAVAGGGLSSSGRGGLFLPGYDDWIPYDPAGSMQYRLQVELAAPQRAVATGQLVFEQITDDRYQARFHSPHAGGPPSLFAGPYEVDEQFRRGLRLRTYFHAELVPLAATYLDAVDTYLTRYQALIGAYPYTDFHVVSAPLPVGLGFENLTYVGRRVIPLPFMRGRSLAHEVLHSWWGNGVAVDYASGNWAEGLTTYLADYALAAERGAEAAREMRVNWLRDFAALPPERDQPVVEFTSKRHQASQVIGYDKVAFIFHMLKNEIGAAAFSEGLSRFWRQFKFRTAGWRDLQATFEHSSGRDLGWFFEQWLARRGAPRLGLGEHDVSRIEGGYLTRFEVSQAPRGYRFKLPVLLATATANREYEFTIEDRRTPIELVTPDKPLYLQLDPGSDVLRRLRRDETPPIMRDVRLNAATRVIIDADDAEFSAVARELAVSLMDVAPRYATLEDLQNTVPPLLLITRRERLPALALTLTLTTPKQLPADKHAAQVWTTRHANGAPVMVVAAENIAELELLLRPLPHYGGRSYGLFSGGRALNSGVWPLPRGALYRDLSALSD